MVAGSVRTSGPRQVAPQSRPTSNERPPLAGSNQLPPLRLHYSSLVAIIVTLTAFNIIITTPERGWFNWYLSVAWSLYTPLALVGLVGVIVLQKRSGGRIIPSSFPGQVTNPVVFVVPSLCRPDTINALRRVMASIEEHAPRNLRTWRVDVVTEEGKASLEVVEELLRSRNVRVLTVPADYATPNRSRFKTRANHYAMLQRRAEGENNPATFVYHLDDDTHVGQDTIASIAEFIAQSPGRHLLAQGMLAFPRELTPSRLAWYVDALRPADDVTRFGFFTGVLHRPLAGLHGEHVIVRSDIEDAIGWDFPDTVIEDAYFALEFARRYPGRSTVLNSFSYGASPSSVRETIRQRRRWAEGLTRLALKRSLPLSSKWALAYSVFVWMASPFQFFAGIVLLGAALGWGSAAPPVHAIGVAWSVGMGVLMWQYMQGLRINVHVSSTIEPRWWRVWLLLPGAYVLAAVETAGAVLGLVRVLGFGAQTESETIAKPH